MSPNKIRCLFILLALNCSAVLAQGANDILWMKGGALNARTLRFTPNGEYVVTGSQDMTVKLWRASDGTLARTIGSHRAPVSCVDMNAAGNLVVSGDETGEISVWSIGGYHVNSFFGHAPGSIIISVEFIAGSDNVASMSTDATIRVWNVRTQTIALTISGLTSTTKLMAVSPDGATVAAIGASNNEVRLYSLTDGAHIRTFF